MSSRYRGRFAPSPTGGLHFGSLVAALASFVDARHNGGDWLVRMEDVDRARALPGADADILRTLDAYGFEWDEPVLYQSTRTDVYEDALRRLHERSFAFHCTCSRAEVAAIGRIGSEGPVYPGTCRRGVAPGRVPRTVRVRVDDKSIGFDDRILGHIEQDLAAEVGDFVVRRADGIHAYQLAVVVDDANQGINQVVRGADLVGSTPRQILLQQALGLSTPTYAHHPVATDRSGRKLGKRDAATPVNARAPLGDLIRAWRFLGQSPFVPLPGSPREFWDQAFDRWRIEYVPKQLQHPMS